MVMPIVSTYLYHSSRHSAPPGTALDDCASSEGFVIKRSGNQGQVLGIRERGNHGPVAVLVMQPQVREESHQVLGIVRIQS